MRKFIVMVILGLTVISIVDLMNYDEIKEGRQQAYIAWQCADAIHNNPKQVVIQCKDGHQYYHTNNQLILMEQESTQ